MCHLTKRDLTHDKPSVSMAEDLNVMQDYGHGLVNLRTIICLLKYM